MASKFFQKILHRTSSEPSNSDRTPDVNQRPFAFKTHSDSGFGSSSSTSTNISSLTNSRNILPARNTHKSRRETSSTSSVASLTSADFSLTQPLSHSGSEPGIPAPAATAEVNPFPDITDSAAQARGRLWSEHRDDQSLSSEDELSDEDDHENHPTQKRASVFSCGRYSSEVTPSRGCFSFSRLFGFRNAEPGVTDEKPGRPDVFTVNKSGKG